MSKDFELIQSFYERHFYTKEMVRKCVDDGRITKEEYKLITGEDY